MLCTVAIRSVCMCVWMAVHGEYRMSGIYSHDANVFPQVPICWWASKAELYFYSAALTLPVV